MKVMLMLCLYASVGICYAGGSGSGGPMVSPGTGYIRPGTVLEPVKPIIDHAHWIIDRHNSREHDQGMTHDWGHTNVSQGQFSFDIHNVTNIWLRSGEAVQSHGTVAFGFDMAQYVESIETLNGDVYSSEDLQGQLIDQINEDTNPEFSWPQFESAQY